MSDLDELRALVREVIRDLLPRDLPVTETVNLSTDQDLAVFVARLLDADAQKIQDLRAGRKRFRLAVPVVPPPSQIALSPAVNDSMSTCEVPGNPGVSGANGRTAVNGSAGPPVRRIERGAVTEAVVVRDAARAGQRLVLGPGAVLTPLGRDRARSSGVEIQKER